MRSWFLGMVLGVVMAMPRSVPAEEPPRTEHGLRTDMWSAPDDPAGQVAAYIAAQSWETSYGGRDPNLTVGLQGAWNLWKWLALSASADFSMRRDAPANLRLTNTSTFLGAGPQVAVWLSFFRLHAEATGGAMLRTLAYTDGVQASDTVARVSPAVQIGGGLDVGLFGAFGLGFRAAGRFHDDRSNVLFVMEVSWFFGGM